MFTVHYTSRPVCGAINVCSDTKAEARRNARWHSKAHADRRGGRAAAALVASVDRHRLRRRVPGGSGGMPGQDPGDAVDDPLQDLDQRSRARSQGGHFWDQAVVLTGEPRTGAVVILKPTAQSPIKNLDELQVAVLRLRPSCSGPLCPLLPASLVLGELAGAA